MKAIKAGEYSKNIGRYTAAFGYYDAALRIAEEGEESSSGKSAKRLTAVSLDDKREGRLT